MTAVPFVARMALLAACLILAPILRAAAEAPTPAEAVDPAEAAEETLLERLSAPWFGDFDEMLARGFLRVGVSFSPLFFVADGPKTSGLTVDALAEFEKQAKERFGADARNLTVMLFPLPRNRMLPALVEGRVDLVAANLTITPDRLEQVDFSAPFAEGVKEVVVLGSRAASPGSLDDLHAVELHVRRSSSYHEHLATLDASRSAAGMPGLRIVAADENLEDEDILELVSVGVIDATVVDDHKAALFAQVIDGLRIREDLAINEGGAIGWAMRKDSPKLREAVDHFAARNRKGTTIGNIVLRRHLGDAERIRDAMQGEDASRFEAVIDIIGKHAAAYDFDALMIAAQGYQESRLDQRTRSKAGAVGIMQVLPSTAGDPAVGIGDIHLPDRNVEAGVKYLRLLRSEYLDDPAISAFDQTMMAFAAYNAGPGNLNKARRRAAKSGLDPDVWFGNVELAMAKAVSREPVIYVRNILKYYVTYALSERRKTTTD